MLATALVVRYVLRCERLSRILLLSLPVVDLLLLAFTAVDLKGGSAATFAHGLATAYIGFTIAFGPALVRWADARFAHRFAGGPAPSPAPVRGWPAVRHELTLWLRCVGAWVVALFLLGALVAYVDDPTLTSPLLAWYRIAFGSVVLWFVFGPLWTLVFLPRRLGGETSA